jgi:hypothetical protein
MMDGGTTRNRREAIGLVSLGMAAAAASAPAIEMRAAEARSSARPGREELERIVRLYGGEFGGGRRGG